MDNPDHSGDHRTGPVHPRPTQLVMSKAAWAAVAVVWFAFVAAVGFAAFHDRQPVADVAVEVIADAIAEDAGQADARVTNCWRRDFYQYAQANCMGTDGNYPYTTQFALMMQCSNGDTYTSGWKPAPNWTPAYVQCPYPHRRVGSSWLLFR